MAIKIGDQLPAGVLWEFIEQETPGCSVGPNSFKVEELVRGKRIAIFGLPGAFTPTCSAKHLPVVAKRRIKARKIDETGSRSTRLLPAAHGAGIRQPAARCG